MRSSATPHLLLLILVLAGLTLSGARPTQAAITPKGQQGCAPGTVVGGENKVKNGDFSQGSALFESQLPDRGTGTGGTGIYPDDGGGGGFSIQTGPKTYFGGQIVGRAFPGDPQREVPAVQTYFYSNPNRDKNGDLLYGPGTPGRALLWRQIVTGLSQNTTYNFFAYFDNLLVPDGNGVDPKIELRVDGIVAGPAISVDKTPDQWIPIQYSFATGAGQTTATLEIYDLADSIIGDDFGMTQISLKQCVTGVGSAKYAYPVNRNSDGSYRVEYLFTIRNLGVDPLPLTNLQVSDNLASTFAAASSFSVVSLTSPTLAVNPAFNGKTDINLLKGTDSLAAGQQATINLRLRVVAGTGSGGKGPFLNSALTTAKAGPIEVRDGSAPGTVPDPNGNGDPKEGSEDKPTPVDFEAKIFLPLIRK